MTSKAPADWQWQAIGELVVASPPPPDDDVVVIIGATNVSGVEGALAVVTDIVDLDAVAMDASDEAGRWSGHARIKQTGERVTILLAEVAEESEPLVVAILVSAAGERKMSDEARSLRERQAVALMKYVRRTVAESESPEEPTAKDKGQVTGRPEWLEPRKKRNGDPGFGDEDEF